MTHEEEIKEALEGIGEELTKRLNERLERNGIVYLSEWCEWLNELIGVSIPSDPRANLIGFQKLPDSSEIINFDHFIEEP